MLHRTIKFPVSKTSISYRSSIYNFINRDFSDASNLDSKVVKENRNKRFPEPSSQTTELIGSRIPKYTNSRHGTSKVLETSKTGIVKTPDGQQPKKMRFLGLTFSKMKIAGENQNATSPISKLKSVSLSGNQNRDKTQETTRRTPQHKQMYLKQSNRQQNHNTRQPANRLRNHKSIADTFGMFEDNHRRRHMTPQNTNMNKKKVASPPVNRKVEITSRITVLELAQRMGIQSKLLLTTLKALGEDGLEEYSYLTSETAELVCLEFDNLTPVIATPDFVDRVITPIPSDTSNLPSRPPIVSVMGHVDHGKTTLLDSLRKTNVAASESGGITQKIGAFSVNLDNESSQRKITFIDTPGHAAFSSMRSRGVIATDVIVLVVAGDDGIKPQTEEVISLARDHNVPLIVAITKCDRSGMDKESVLMNITTQLMSVGVVPESLGGEVQIVFVSGKTGEGLEDLKQAIVLQADIMELGADDKAQGEGIILESSTQPGLGCVADILVRWGTFKQGSYVVAGTEFGKIRVLLDEHGKKLKVASPSSPVRIVGLKGVPSSGQYLLTVNSESEAREIVENRQMIIERQIQDDLMEDGDRMGTTKKGKKKRKIVREWIPLRTRRQNRANVIEAMNQETERVSKLKYGEEGYIAKTIPFIFKAESNGALDAIDDLLASVPQDELVPKSIRSSIGPVTSSDIDIAAACGATIFTFNVKNTPSINNEAKRKLIATRYIKVFAHIFGVNIRPHQVIYHLLDDLKNVIESQLEPIIETKIVGTAEVLQSFVLSGKGKPSVVGGCRILDGKFTMDAQYQIIRNDKVIHQSANAESLRHFKQKVKEVVKGSECGLLLPDFSDFLAGDRVEAYVKVETRRKL